MRKSILACTVSFLMSPMAAWALGMGDIQVNSSLNQPLNAEIGLHSLTKKDLDSLRIGMASASAYSRSGLERSNFLSKLKFKVVERGGKHYVNVTTRQPFREPFANFLIEANWSSGRLLREYTILVDPPEFVKAQARPITPAVASRSSQVKRSAPAKSTAGKTTQKSKDSDYVLSPSMDDSELIYGPTKRNDTLWTIAKNMAPANISIDQMMLALLRDNPEAFVGNNINNLKAGYVLRIKDASSLNQLDRSNAFRQVKEQYQSWKETRKQDVSNANLVDRSDRSRDASPEDEGRLELVATGSSDAERAQGDLESQSNQLKDKLVLAGEELESKEIENQELRDRIKELEELLKTKTSLVELKDESLAALQKQQQMEGQQSIATEGMTETITENITETMVEEPQVSLPVEIIEVTEEMLAQHVDPSVELARDAGLYSEEVMAEEAADETVSMQETVIEASAESVMPAETITPEPVAETTAPETAAAVEAATPDVEIAPVVEDAPVAVAKPETKPQVKQPQTQKRPAPAPQENIVELLTSDEYLPYTAGAGGLLIALLAWLGLRGRGEKEHDFEESILDSKLSNDESDSGTDASKRDESGSETSTEVMASDAETSFLSDFSSDDMESLQPDDTEADPVAEADVFMVYGRYQQAEELLKGAIKEDPERLDYQMKLLEVYHGDNLKDSFAVQADVVRDLLKQNNNDYELTSEWTKAKSWADKLDVDIEMPDSFEEGIPDAAVKSDFAIDSSDTMDELSLDDIDDELSLESEEIKLNEDSILGDITDTDENEEFDLSFDDSLNASSEDTSELSLDDLELDSDIDQAIEADDEIDLNLSNIDSDDLETTDNFDANDEIFDLDETTLELDDGLDLEDNTLELVDNALEESADTAETTLDLEDNLELDDGLESNSDVNAADQGSLATADDELDLLNDDMGFDELEDDFPELDAVGTKLDLAKAYIDMGDTESASSILKEVIDEGDEEQKSQAQALLNQAES